MSVTTKHPEYNYNYCRWELVRDLVKNDVKHLIRQVDVNDPKRTRQYREDAILTNFTRLTREGLAGLVFRKETVITLPPELDYLDDDATGFGLDLNQLSVKVVNEILQTGRLGLFTDFMGDLAYIKPYCAESIINHKCRLVNGKYQLCLVVLEEHRDYTDYSNINAMFEPQEECIYRVLFLNDQGIYQQAIYNKDSVLIEDIITPLKADGSVWNEIPFVFIGSENNDPDFDAIPLYDLAVINLGHYRNSADYEEAIFIAGQPFPVICVGDTSIEEFKAANPNGVTFGSRSGLTVGMHGNATLLQANANQLPDEAMKRKEEQAAAIGARLIAPAGGRETAEGARIRYSAQNASLYLMTYNISEAFEDSLEYVCEFMGADDSNIEFELNTQFYDESADPNLIAQQIMMFDRGIIARTDILDYARKTGVVRDTRTDEEIAGEYEQDNPFREQPETEQE